jgi:plastocyanin
MKELNVLVSTAVLTFAICSTAFSGTEVFEGDDGLSKFEAMKASAVKLKQRDRKFSIVSPDGSEDSEATVLHVIVNQTFFITNEEDRTTHNVYDHSDSNWVLMKQVPGGVAAIAFDTAGEHDLRCAIHPKMKMKVIVEE